MGQQLMSLYSVLHLVEMSRTDSAKGYFLTVIFYFCLFHLFSSNSTRKIVTGPIAPSSAVITLNELQRIKVFPNFIFSTQC